MKELRKLLFTWTSIFTFWILPDGEFKKAYAIFMKDNIMNL